MAVVYHLTSLTQASSVQARPSRPAPLHSTTTAASTYNNAAISPFSDSLFSSHSARSPGRVCRRLREGPSDAHSLLHTPVLGGLHRPRLLPVIHARLGRCLHGQRYLTLPAPPSTSVWPTNPCTPSSSSTHALPPPSQTTHATTTTTTHALRPLALHPLPPAEGEGERVPLAPVTQRATGPQCQSAGLWLLPPPSSHSPPLPELGPLTTPQKLLKIFFTLAHSAPT
ncbi:hypothetical protein Pcinc_043716 [Petrolisthes cinctipes]|uniref:Uncharacterized protein n=1 Tax=Petrolisthes cinctipes TaxID=88211 RepID=A0AAE1BIM9_PETCI|nr:hypothetical protein Pcinc_043716 [Petrolisthes cinctipes]